MSPWKLINLPNRLRHRTFVELAQEQWAKWPCVGLCCPDRNTLPPNELAPLQVSIQDVH